jgi:hypothetical protein
LFFVVATTTYYYFPLSCCVFLVLLFWFSLFLLLLESSTNYQQPLRRGASSTRIEEAVRHKKHIIPHTFPADEAANLTLSQPDDQTAVSKSAALQQAYIISKQRCSETYIPW